MTGHAQDAPAELEINGAIATITLNRPRSYNSINVEMARVLKELAGAVEHRSDVRVLVIRGAGKAFCAGGDIQMFVEHIDNLAPPITELLTHLKEFLITLRRMPQLVVTSVHGAAAGAGFSLAFMGDFCIAANNARFRPAYAQIGISPDAGGTDGVVRAVGARRALQLFLAEQELSSEQAGSLGLVSEVVPEADLDEATVRYAERLASINPAAASATKQLIWHSSQMPLPDQLDAEMAGVLRCMATEEFKARARSFGSR